MIRSSIDLGTNTCLLLIADCDPESGEIQKVLADHQTVVRLGQDVDKKGEFVPAAMERTLACLQGYAKEVQRAGGDPQQAICIATSSARDARNSEEFFDRVAEALRFHFKIITGQDEAQLSFQGALLPGMNPKEFIVIDIGGGSTEYMSTRAGMSLDLGSVRFTERFLKSDPVSDGEFQTCLAAIDAEIQTLKAWRATQSSNMRLLAVAGTATTLAKWHLGQKNWDADPINQLELTTSHIHQKVQALKEMTVAERTKIVDPKRADVLLAGAMILWRSMEVLGFENTRISTRGLRYGVLTLVP